jgi:CRP-like cAMP-binding protein
MQIDNHKNLLLQRLPADIQQDILRHAELVHLDLHERVHEPDKEIKFVDFPNSGVWSLITPMEDKSLVELATVGREGMIGIPLLLDVRSNAQLVFCQVEGTAARIEAKAFHTLLEKHPEFDRLCRRYTLSVFDQVARNNGCNRLHSIEARCARWMLLTLDRCDGNQFPLTQEFLAAMLGVSRTGVNLAAGGLARRNCISYVRGRVKVLDRAELERTACACYNAMNRDFEKLMGPYPVSEDMAELGHQI